MQDARAELFESGEVVRDHDHRQTGVAAKVGQQTKKAALAVGIKARERFVEDERLRPACQEAGDHHPAHLPATELVDPPLRQ